MIDNRPGDPPNGRRQHTPVVVVAAGCEGLALLASVAANLLAVYTDGAIAIGFALLVPLILIGGTYLFLFDRLPVAWSKRSEGWQAWWANLVAAALILIPVASASYWHQRELLVATGSPTWIATLLPLAVDGLALRAALTLFRLAHGEPASTGVDTRQDTAVDAPADTSAATTSERHVSDPVVGDVPVDTDEPEAPLPPVPAVPGVDPAAVALAVTVLATDPTIGRPNLRRTLLADGHRVTDHGAKRLLDELRPVRPVAAGEAS